MSIRSHAAKESAIPSTYAVDMESLQEAAKCHPRGCNPNILSLQYALDVGRVGSLPRLKASPTP